LTEKIKEPLLLDHVDNRLVATNQYDSSKDRNDIVQLDPDHPGFRDEEYRARRNRIAQLALDYKPGQTIPNAPYTREEHELWRIIWDALGPAHQAHACTEYLDALQRLGLPRQRIPQLSELSERVWAISGFRLEPVAGLVQPRVFLESLADGVFLCTQYIRHHSAPYYTPEPDVVHEVAGHAVSLASEPLAELNRLVGEAVKHTSSTEDLERLSRVYWFTIEFGIVRENEHIKAFGTGLLSSAGELEAMHNATVRPLDLNLVARQHYDPTKYQPVLFCADSFVAMYQKLKAFLMNWYE
jgi:phenylalanine-4-hydroxylase